MTNQTHCPHCNVPVTKSLIEDNDGFCLNCGNEVYPETEPVHNTEMPADFQF